MHFRVDVQFENVTAGVRFCREMTRPNIAVIR
jgi:hypothetical protein